MNAAGLTIGGTLAIPTGATTGYVLTSDTSGNCSWGPPGAGPQGTQGRQGFQGTAGVNGTQGTTGANGTQGVSGTNGTNGTQGTSGTNGTQGNQGVAGVNGTQGTAGANGTQGNQGVTGAGTQGTTGTAGTQGNQGIAGSGTAAGSTTQVQYNNAGAFAGSANLTWDNANTRLGVGVSPGLSTLDVQGSIRFKRTVVSSTPYTVLATDNIVAVTGPASARVLNLPAASTIPAGQCYIFSDESGNAATNNITITRNGTDTIEGLTTKVINQNYGATRLYSDGSTKWFSTVDIGNQGFQGVAGSNGTQGTAGSNGTQGTAGANGTQGNQGVTGAGTQGTAGSNGTQGNQGIAGSGTAAGSTTQVQYNNAGAFAGSANLTWDNTNTRLGIGVSPGLSTLDVQGSIRFKRTVVSSTPYTVLATDNIVAVTGPASARVLNLPAASTIPAGQCYIISDESGNASTNNITITRAGADTIEGATTKVINQNYGATRIYSDGSSKWFTTVDFGSQGFQGAAGANGTQGVAGANGTQGTTGSAGTQGTQGLTGAGTQGNQGNTGPQGGSGALSIGATTIGGGTTGSALFVGASTFLQQDNANFFYDDTNNYLGVGTNTPSASLDVRATNGTSGLALRLKAGTQSANIAEWYDASNVIRGSILPAGGLLVSGAYTETSTTAGVHSGIVSATPRVLFANGTAAQNWQIDNNSGTFRWYLPGVPHMTLSSTVLSLPSKVLNVSGAGSSFIESSLTVGANTTPAATLDVQGGMRLKRTVVSSTPYTVLATDNIIAVTGPASARVLNLPSAATIPAGQGFIFSDESGNASTNNITITRNGSDTIEGLTTKVINQNYGATKLYSDGSTKWFTTTDFGSQGNQGAAGSNGTQGTAGTNGTQGVAGTNGTQGAAGTNGTQGTQGVTGAGTQGVQGTTGPQGGSGALSIGATTIGGGTTGSALFVGASTFLQQDNANFFWDSTNHRLGLGTTTPQTTLDVRGGMSLKRTAVSSTPYTVLATDNIIGITGPASARVINLPSAASTTAGQIYVISDESGNASTNNITINRNGTDTIEGATSKVLNQNYAAVRLYSDGSGHWFTTVDIGNQGNQGAAGSNGTQGTAGTNGTQGVAGTNGTNGTQGTTGANGTQGVAGTNGTNGTQGTAGANGTQGVAGTNGTNGTQGTTGANGTQGNQGVTGAGTQGVQGTTGPQGGSGALSIGATTIGGGTTGSILFVGGSTFLQQDNASLFWDDTNNRLGLINTSPQATLDVQGGVRFKRNPQTSSYTVTSTDFLVAYTTLAAPVTLTLPSAASTPAGQSFVISDESGNAGTNNITVTRAGTDTIEGATTKVINSAYGALRLYSDGSTKWFTTGQDMKIGSAVGGSTTGSILYSDGSKNLAQDNSNLFWDGTNHRLGLAITTPLSTLDVQGSIRFKRTVVSSTPYTVLATDNIVAVTGPASARVLNLPAASTIPAGQCYIFSDESGNAGTNNITITRAGSDTIEGNTTKVINQNYGATRLYSDGSTKWFSTVDIGNQGFQGAAGSNGTQGTAGTNGTQGTQGTAGTNGTQGVQGLTGAGTQGTAGTTGTQGNQGTAGSGTAAGSTTQVQYNNAGAFAGSANLTWDNTNTRLGIGVSPGLSTLDVQGSIRFKRTVVSSTPYTVLATDNIVAVTGPASARVLNLPAASTIPAGQCYIFSDESGNASTNNITITRNGTDTIEGLTTKVINQNYGATRLYSDGSTKWFSTVDIGNQGFQGGVGAQGTAGSGTAAGSTTQVQYNNAGAFAGGTNLVWDNTNSRLTVGNTTGTTAPLTIGSGATGDKLRIFGATESNVSRYGLGIDANTFLAYTDGTSGTFSFRKATASADPTTGTELMGVSNNGQVTVSTQAVGTIGAQIRQFSGSHTGNLLELTSTGGTTKLSYFGPQGFLKLGANSWAPQCALDVEGGISFKRRAVSTTPTTVTSSDYMIAVTGPSSARVINLPAAAAVGNGQFFVISDEAGNAATNTITVNRAGSDTIEGATTYVISQNYGAVRFYSNGSNAWYTTTQAQSVTDLTNAVILAPAASTRNVVTPTGDFKALTLKAGSGSQTQNMMEILNNSSTIMDVFGPQGYLGIGTGATAPISPLDVRGTVNNQVTMSIRPTGSATSDIIQIYNTAAAVATSFDKDGYGLPISYRFALAIGVAATTGTNKTNIMVVERACKVVKCFIVAKTAPTGAALICDIKKGGTTIWSTTGNRIQLAASATTGTQTNFDTTTFSEGDQLTIDIAQVGSTVAGQDITVQLLTLAKNN